MNSKCCVLIVAGGSGSRMKTEIPKQFLNLNGKPVIIHTISAFLDVDSNFEFVISVHENYKTWLHDAIRNHHLNHIKIHMVTGGASRAESVMCGLQAVPERFLYVAIHDAARPMVSKATILRCLHTCFNFGNAIPCIEVADSLRKINNNTNCSVNRNEYKQIQTPQCFNRAEIRHAYHKTTLTQFTDDATVFENAGHSIHLVEGNVENIKITTPIDFKLIELLHRG
jgi:2-C-methyl-D-erythritol 4-phosphate cytidylyltransferase